MSELTRFPARASVSRRLGAWALGAQLAVSSAAGAQDAPPPEADAVGAIERAADRYRDVQAMCADFRQTIAVALLRRTIASEGRICQKRPNLFSMRFTDPAGDVVISDGRHFWIHYPSVDAEQVVRQPVAVGAGRHDFLRALLENPAARHAVRDGGFERVDDRPCRVVTLVPKAAGDGFAYRRARVWLDAEEDLVRRIELHEENGNVRTVTLERLDLEPTLDPDLFTFRPPPGARVRGATPADPGPAP